MVDFTTAASVVVGKVNQVSSSLDTATAVINSCTLFRRPGKVDSSYARISNTGWKRIVCLELINLVPREEGQYDPRA